MDIAMSFRRILIAIDDSLLGDHAADVGVELARALDADLALVHVVNPPVLEECEYDARTPVAELITIAQNRGKETLAATRHRLGLKETVQEFLELGDPAEHILKIAATWATDLIVVGSHGRSGIMRAILGSVAEAVTRHAACPVLVVRPKD